MESIVEPNVSDSCAYINTMFADFFKDLFY